jgi:hypothetical protein
MQNLVNLLYRETTPQLHLQDYAGYRPFAFDARYILSCRSARYPAFPREVPTMTTIRNRPADPMPAEDQIDDDPEAAYGCDDAEGGGDCRRAGHHAGAGVRKVARCSRAQVENFGEVRSGAVM